MFLTYPVYTFPRVRICSKIHVSEVLQAAKIHVSEVLRKYLSKNAQISVKKKISFYYSPIQHNSPSFPPKIPPKKKHSRNR